MHPTFYRFAFVIALAALILSPGTTLAASKPTCELAVTSSRGETSTKKEMDIFARSGESLTLSWESKNAKKAVGDDRNDIELEGSMTVDVERSTSYSFVFSNGNKKAECEVAIRVAEARFDTSTLSTDDSKPEIAGEASGTKTVRLEVTNSAGKRVFTGKDVRLKKGEWEAKVTKTLKEGTYTATLFGEKKYELNALATSTLTILPKGSSIRGGSISVSPLALLTGGVATPGTSVPVAYVQVRNSGYATTSIQGFTLLETGSVTDDIVTGFSVTDDKGGSRATYGGSEGTTQFKKGSVYVPLAYTLASGELRIFTIKAILSGNKRLYGNAELKINVASVDTGASVSGTFPVPGTTWVLR